MHTHARFFCGFAAGAVLALLPLGAFAAIAPSSMPTNATIVASVSIQGATIQSLEGRTATVSFSLYNSRGVQPDIRYGIKLLSSAPGTKAAADESIAAETLTLSPEEAALRTITYTAPPYISGSYDIWVEAATGNGLPLGAAFAGKAVFPKSVGGFAEIIPSSCFLTVAGSATHHPLSEGVRIKPPQTLEGNCTVKSHFSSTQILTPAFRLHKRSVFGVLEQTQPSAQTISLSSGETKTFAFPIPLGKEPQAYIAAMSLQNGSGESVSNPVIFSYMTEGSAATILNVTLDKSQYANKEAATIAVSWSGASTATSSTPFTLSLSLSGSGGACASTVSMEVRTTAFGTSVPMPITMPCRNPSVTVTLADADGTTLDQKTVAVPSGNAAPNNHVFQQLLFLLLTLAVLGGAFFFLRRARTGGKI